MRLRVKQKEKQRLQDASDVVSLKNLIQPSAANRAGTWIPEAQAVKHDEQRPDGQNVRLYKNRESKKTQP